MKKIFYIILLVLGAVSAATLLPTPAFSQIKVYDKETYYDHETDSVVVTMKVEAQKVKGTVAVDFVIRDKQGNWQPIPAVIYAKPGRYNQVRRSVDSPWIYRNKGQSFLTDYRIAVPYVAWMDNASLEGGRVRFERCGQWLEDATTIVHNIHVEPDPIVEIAPEPAVWKPNPALWAMMTGFIDPEVEGVKNRAATASVNIDYPVNVYKVMPAYGKNPDELPKVDTLMASIMGDQYITVNSFRITGYASPEGRYTSNERLAKNRSLGFKDYLQAKYSTGKIPVYNDWVAEDWDGLVKVLQTREMNYRDEALQIIAGTDIFDSRESKLMRLGGGHPYKEMLSEIFPGLRRIELRADFTVRSFTDIEAHELIYTRPDLLSLDEMYRVALFYRPGTPEYSKVYGIAATYYPKDVIANNNAAAAALLEGDTETAVRFLDKIKDDPRSYINRGVIAYIEGDLDTAELYFRTAARAGYPVAERNLELLKGEGLIKDDAVVIGDAATDETL